MVRNTKRWNWEPKRIFEMKVKMGEAMETELKRLKKKCYGDEGESAVEREIVSVRCEYFLPVKRDLTRLKERYFGYTGETSAKSDIRPSARLESCPRVHCLTFLI